MIPDRDNVENREDGWWFVLLAGDVVVEERGPYVTTEEAEAEQAAYHKTLGDNP